MDAARTTAERLGSASHALAEQAKVLQASGGLEWSAGTCGQRVLRAVASASYALGEAITLIVNGVEPLTSAYAWGRLQGARRLCENVYGNVDRPRGGGDPRGSVAIECPVAADEAVYALTVFTEALRLSPWTDELKGAIKEGRAEVLPMMALGAKAMALGPALRLDNARIVRAFGWEAAHRRDRRRRSRKAMQLIMNLMVFCGAPAAVLGAFWFGGGLTEPMWPWLAALLLAMVVALAVNLVLYADLPGEPRQAGTGRGAAGRRLPDVTR